MHKRSYYIVNGITLYRLIAAPLLLVLIISHRPDIFKWLLTVSFSTDAIDGYFARKYKVISKWGAKLDSIADDLTIAVATIGISMFKPEFLRREIAPILTVLVLFIIQTVFAVFRYKKMSSFHTYGAKIAAILQGIFLLLLFFLDEPVYILFYVTVAVTAIELVEEIIMVQLLPQWEANVKGLYWVIRKKQSG